MVTFWYSRTYDFYASLYFLETLPCVPYPRIIL